MKLRDEVKVFCRKENFIYIDEIFDALNIDDNAKLITTKNRARCKFLLNKFKYDNDIHCKDISVLFGNMSLSPIVLTDDLIVIYLEGVEKKFTKSEDIKMLIVFEQEVKRC